MRAKQQIPLQRSNFGSAMTNSTVLNDKLQRDGNRVSPMRQRLRNPVHMPTREDVGANERARWSRSGYNDSLMAITDVTSH